MPGVVQITGSKRVIALAEIREKFLSAEIYLDAIVKPADVLAGIPIEQKIGPVADFHVEPFPKQFVKEVVRLAEPRPKIAKIDVHSLFHFRSVNGGKMGCQGRAILIPTLHSGEETRIRIMNRWGDRTNARGAARGAAVARRRCGACD